MNAFAKLRGDAPLVVYIDLKSPYAYLAVEPTRHMARAARVRIEWRPFTLDIPSYLGSAKLDRKGKVAKSERTPQQWSGVKYAYMDARRYANLTGRTVRGTVKIWNSSLAGIAMLWAGRHGRLDAFLDVAYPPFWRRELDIDDVDVLAASLAEAGIPRHGFAAFADGEGRAEHDRINDEAFAAGVFGVPTYLVEDEMWFGREHLPRVAWLLGGREGAAPDVANLRFGPDSAPPEAATTSKPALESRGGADPGDIDASPLTVLLHVAHPGCFLALGAALDAAAELEAAGHGPANWLPIEAPTLNPPSRPGADDDRSVLHRRHRAEALAREFETYSAAAGLVVKEPYRSPDTSAFRLAWLWLRQAAPGKLPAFLREGFRAYWNLELDPSDLAAVTRVLDGAGANPGSEFPRWCEQEGRRTDAAIAGDLHSRGLFAAPGYVVGSEYFQGRQHLPMIRWILGGRQGHGPI